MNGTYHCKLQSRDETGGSLSRENFSNSHATKHFWLLVSHGMKVVALAGGVRAEFGHFGTSQHSVLPRLVHFTFFPQLSIPRMSDPFTPYSDWFVHDGR